MKDRVGTEVLQNGARRYAQYDASGVLQGYTYLLLADEPTEAGTALNKANLLSDATAAALGLSGDPTVNDAFAKMVHETSITLLSSGWSNTAPYTYTYTLSSVLANQGFSYALDPSATTESVAEAFGFISTAAAAAGSLVFKCNADKPTVNIPIVVRGV